MDGMTPEQAVSLYSNDNPFVSAHAYAHSNYSMYHDGALVRLLDWREPSARARFMHNTLRAFVLGPAFSCVAARAAFSSGGYRFGYYAGMDDVAATQGLARDLCAFAAEFDHIHLRYKTFVATFGGRAANEESFETSLWKLLTRLHELDAPCFSWDPSVSSDPRDASFAFSFAGVAFFVVGLHPRSARRSRRFSAPALAFNAHKQFHDLRASGMFERVRGHVRARELALEGSLNPNLAEFGENSEARQYAGRAVDAEWKCPFRR